jgi:hypothetical protein
VNINPTTGETKITKTEYGQFEKSIGIVNLIGRLTSDTTVKSDCEQAIVALDKVLKRITVASSKSDKMEVNVS